MAKKVQARAKTKKSVVKAKPVKKAAAAKPAPKVAKSLKAVKNPPKKDVKPSKVIKNAGKASTPPPASATPKKVTKAAPVAAPVTTKATGKKGAAPVSAPAAKPLTKPVALTKVAKGKAAGEPAKKRANSRSLEDACREIACESVSTTAGYCRLHYIKNWKKIKRKELILREKKLNQYIEELVSKYPDKYIEAIKMDLSDEKAFSKVIYDLELDESVDDIDVDGENEDQIIDNIGKRGGFDDDAGDF
jgi:hypothetical protein